MQKPTSAASPTPIKFVIVTMDSHLASAMERARSALVRDLPGLQLSMHAAAEWSADPAALERCRADIETGDIIVNTMLFLEDHFQPILPSLQKRREQCDAMVSCMSAGEVTKLTRMGRFSMDGSTGGPLAMLKRLRGAKGKGGASSAGAQQMKMLRRIPRLLRFIPGAAQDVRAYFLTLQYWLGGSEENVANMVRFLVDRYADGARRTLRGHLAAAAPTEYPEIGVYHPRLKQKFTEDAGWLERLKQPQPALGTVGVLLLRSYLLAGNAAHYDGVIAALEARGLRVIPAFATGLDAREAVERFFLKEERPVVDAVVSLTGFSLVGGPAYNDAKAAEEMLARLDVPYIAALPVEFQTLEQWGASERGLMPVESTIMVAISTAPPARSSSGDARMPPARPAPAATAAAPSRLRRMRATCIRASSATRCSPRVSQSWLPCAAPRGPSARSRWCCSISRRTPATPDRPPTCPCSSRSTARSAPCRPRGIPSICRRVSMCCARVWSRAMPSATAPMPTCMPRFRSRTMCGANGGWPRSRRSGARHRDAS